MGIARKLTTVTLFSATSFFNFKDANSADPYSASFAEILGVGEAWSGSIVHVAMNGTSTSNDCSLALWIAPRAGLKMIDYGFDGPGGVGLVHAWSGSAGGNTPLRGNSSGYTYPVVGSDCPWGVAYGFAGMTATIVLEDTK